MGPKASHAGVEKRPDTTDFFQGPVDIQILMINKNDLGGDSAGRPFAFPAR
jgi:hypothetical protein